MGSFFSLKIHIYFWSQSLGDGAAPGGKGKGGKGAADGLGGKGKAGGKDVAAGGKEAAEEGKEAAAGGKDPAAGGKEAAAGGKEAGEHTPAEANRLSQHKCLQFFFPWGSFGLDGESFH